MTYVQFLNVAHALVRMMKKLDNRLPYGRGSEPLLNRDRKGAVVQLFSTPTQARRAEIRLDTSRILRNLNVSR